MSLWKIILIAAILSLLLFAGGLIYALYPKIRNVSEKTGFSHLTGKELRLKRETYFYRMGDGMYRFEPLLMSSDRNYPFEKKVVLPAGSLVKIEKFKTYSSAGNKVTEVYAIGTAHSHAGDPFRFEYEWGSVQGQGILKLAPWQDSTEKRMEFSAD